MRHHFPSRREFLQGVSATAGALIMARRGNAADAAKPERLHVSCNQYPWSVFYQREGRDFSKALDASLAEVARSGLDGFEPSGSSPAQIADMGAKLKAHGLQMRSVYVGSALHDPQLAQQSIRDVVAVAEKAREFGTKIIVTNPNPLAWGGPQNKDDAQLRIQAEGLDKLGAAIKGMGMTLAYHNHDMELRNAAREFHHMMVGTDTANVTLCLDAHWVYRGAGNSSVALFDVVKLYGSRISELHLRQSAKNIWTEAFCDGDIDYGALARQLRAIGVRPLLVLEQCPEQSTPKTMGSLESCRRSRAYLEQVFGD